VSLNVDPISDINSYGIDFRNREIYLHSYVGNTDEDPGVDYRMASTFYKNIRLLDSQNKKPILIHMHSIGGEWADGMAIFDAISICQSFVTILVYGQAESMSSIILQAADRRVMMPNSYFMCHYGSSGYDGTYQNVQKAASFEKREAEYMMDIYADHMLESPYIKAKYTEPTHEKVKNLLKRKFKDGDWYLNSEETVYHGFADHVINSDLYPTIDSLKQ
jgi:ATP-dependent protease ClpP protease subunit